jgi:hypothetical protein
MKPEQVNAMDSLRFSMPNLPEHQCAYCGSLHTVLQMIEPERESVSFSIFCNSCNKIDRPMLLTRELMKVLRAIG